MAATGCLDNLQLLAQHAGFALSAQVLGAAAAGGHVDTCRWLRAEGAPWTDTMQYSVLDAAAASGQGHMVDWLLDNWCSWSDSAAGAAARGGHVALVQKLLALHEANPARRPVDPRKLLEGAAEGCSAAELKVLHDTWVHGRAELMEGAKEDVVAAAAGSCTPDWRAKLEFLVLGRAYPRTPLAYKRAVAQPDALERMVWLQRAGFPLTKANGSVNAVHFAALTGGVDALRYLLDNGGVADAGAASRAASRGNVDALRELHARGCPIPSYALREAAEAGHLLTVSWLADLFTHQQQQQQQQEEEAVLTADVFAAAAESGSLELMQWLAARGCPMDAEAFTAAAHAGSQEQLEWLVEQGCPMGVSWQPGHPGMLQGFSTAACCQPSVIHSMPGCSSVLCGPQGTQRTAGWGNIACKSTQQYCDARPVIGPCPVLAPCTAGRRPALPVRWLERRRGHAVCAAPPGLPLGSLGGDAGACRGPFWRRRRRLRAAGAALDGGAGGPRAGSWVDSTAAYSVAFGRVWSIDGHCKHRT